MNALETKSIQQWIEQGKKTCKEYVFYNGHCLDLTSFKKLHPGGSQVIKNYLFKDVTHILYTIFPHNRQTTPKILQKYRIGILNQTSTQISKKQGTILKQRNNQRENTLKKKQVKFSSEVKKAAAQQERNAQIQQSKLMSSKKSLKKSTIIQTNTSEIKSQKKSKKKINQDYLDALKGSKGPTKSTKSIEDHLPAQNHKKQCLSIIRLDSGQIQDDRKSNMSISRSLKRSWGSIKDLVEQTISAIKVPVLNVRLNRIW